MKKIRKKIELWIDKKSSNPKRFSLCMTESEIEFFKLHTLHSKEYLEFGAGGSTFLMLLKTNANVTTVESDNGWLDSIREWKTICLNEGNRLKFVHLNIGKTKEWGYPENEDLREFWPDYSQKIFNMPDVLNPQNIDTVFIDGRFRVACALCAILHCKNVNILIHDFWNRPDYHILLEFLEVKNQVDTMGLFTIKKEISKEKVRALLETYQYTLQ